MPAGTADADAEALLLREDEAVLLPALYATAEVLLPLTLEVEIPARLLLVDVLARLVLESIVMYTTVSALVDCGIP